MSVPARSRRSAGRPNFGRPVAAVVALIVTFAVGAPAAVAGESPDPIDPVPDLVDVPTPEPVVPDVPSAEPDPPLVDPPVTGTPPVDPTTAEAPVAPPAPIDPAPPVHELAPSPPAETQSTPAATTSPPTSGHKPSVSGEAKAVSENVSRVIQAVWQVQQGCRTYCYGTSQTQRSVQWSETTQSATAVSGEPVNVVSTAGVSSAGSTARARNESSTFQFVWQTQIGCVAFCFDTSQTQEASQHAGTDQEADARSALMAWADNLAETVQYVFQTQQGCEHECHGTSQSQSVSQEQWTRQSATATSGLPGDGDGGVFEVPDWLIAYARNLGATIQVVRQYQEATCAEHCNGDAQLQEAIQRAMTSQVAVAVAPPPPEATIEQPSVVEPPAPDPEPQSPTPSMVGHATTSLAAAFIVDRGRRSAQRRELVLRLNRKAQGGGSTPPTRSTDTGLAQGRSAGQGSDAAASTAVSADLKASGPTGAVARKAGEQRAARTFTVPVDDTRGGAGGWLVILLLAVALGLCIAFNRTELAPTFKRI